MLKQRPFLIETLTAIGLIAAPFVLPHLGFAPNTVNRILVWGLFGLGFDILFGFTGLLSFGQSAFYGTGGFVAAYLLTRTGFSNVLGALIIGMIAAAVTGYLIGLIALRRTGIYFAMITVAIAEVFFFVEFNPLSDWTGGENGLPGVPTPSFNLGFTTLQFTNGWSLYQFIALCYFIGIVIALRIVRSPVGAIFSAIRDNPLRATAVGHNIHGYKLTAFVIAAAYAGFAGGLLGVLQAFMPPDAFTFDTSGQLVMQTAIGGRGTLFGPLVGAAVWLFLQDFLQAALGLGAAWKLVLGVVFVLLVCFLRGGIVGGLVDLYGFLTGKRSKEPAEETPSGLTAEAEQKIAEAAIAKEVSAVPTPAQHARRSECSGPILHATGLTKRYGGLVANSDIDFTVNRGELRGIIGPNGAGKSTFFKMLTCEIPPTSGSIVFEGRDITGMNVTDVCQLGLTKSYQVNQLFSGLTVRDNIVIAALAELRGRFRLDMFSSLDRIPGLNEQRRTHARTGQPRIPAPHPGVGARLWREAPARDRACARHLAEPVAAGRATGGHVAARTRRDGQPPEVDQPRPHHDHHRSRHGRAVRARRARDRVAGRPRPGRGHAGGNQEERRGAGGLSRRRPWSDRPMNLLEVNALNSYYGDSHILFDVSLRVERNEVVALLGRNGAGKSTTLKSLMGVVTPRTGSVKLDGIDLAGRKSHAVAQAGMQLVHEERRIFGSLNVEENLVIAGLTASKRWPLDRIYEMFPRLKERRANRGTDLSGGEQQMLAIARALVRDPKILLLDEPFEGLAPIIVRDLMKVCRDLAAAGQTIVLVEQNLAATLALARRIYIINNGHIVHEGPAAEIKAQPEVLQRYLGV